MPRKSRQEGFVLVVALVLLALAGAILAAAARQSSLLAIQANASCEDLQRRWAITTIQRTFLDKVDWTISQAEGDRKHPLSWAKCEFELGRLKVQLVLGDEQAKANANAVLARRGWQATRQMVQSLSAMGRAPAEPVLREPAADPATPAFESWEHLLEVFVPEDLVGSDLGDASLVNQLTLWGDGRLNFRRAARAALEAATAGVLDDAKLQRVLALREEIPGLALKELIPRLELDDQQRLAAVSALTDKSMAFSLWIVLQGRQRQWHYLAVQAPAIGDQGPPVKTFSW